MMTDEDAKNLKNIRMKIWWLNQALIGIWSRNRSDASADDLHDAMNHLSLASHDLDLAGEKTKEEQNG